MGDFLEVADSFRFLADLFMAWGRELAEFTDSFHDHWVLCNVCTKIASPGAVFCFNVSYALERLALIFTELQSLIERVSRLEELVLPQVHTLFIPHVENAPATTDAELWLEELIEGVGMLPG